MSSALSPCTSSPELIEKGATYPPDGTTLTYLDNQGSNMQVVGKKVMENVLYHGLDIVICPESKLKLRNSIVANGIVIFGSLHLFNSYVSYPVAVDPKQPDLALTWVSLPHTDDYKFSLPLSLLNHFKQKTFPDPSPKEIQRDLTTGTKLTFFDHTGGPYIVTKSTSLKKVCLIAADVIIFPEGHLKLDRCFLETNRIIILKGKFSPTHSTCFAQVEERDSIGELALSPAHVTLYQSQIASQKSD